MNVERGLLTRVTSALRRIVGMPDYAAYVVHMRDQHPECAVPTEREYFNLYLDTKYNGGPGSRCC